MKNRIRRMLMAFFPNRDCVTLKRPVEDEAMLQKIDNAPWEDLRPEFVQQVQVRCRSCACLVETPTARKLCARPVLPNSPPSTAFINWAPDRWYAAIRPAMRSSSRALTLLR